MVFCWCFHFTTVLFVTSWFSVYGYHRSCLPWISMNDLLFLQLIWVVGLALVQGPPLVTVQQ